MGWREGLSRFSGPGVLAGIRLGDWLRLLRENGFRVDWPYWPRAAFITCSAAMNSLAGWYEQWRHRRAIETATVEPPLFVLGHWRSGTTLLHDLLAVDRRFAYPNLYQVNYPHTFLTTEKRQSGFMRFMMPKRRPQDNMRFDPATSWEDEFVMCAEGLRTSYITWAFPRRAEHYDRYLTFRRATSEDVATWRAALIWFLKKLTFNDGRNGGRPLPSQGRTLVLKSPPHTGRIRLLLETFPGARFVHIHRDPYRVFQSTVHLAGKALPLCLLQRAEHIDWAGRIIGQYREMYDAFFEERGLIPAGQFHEVCFEELERDLVGQMRILYRALGLPDFAEVEQDLQHYAASLAGYQKNTFRELPGDQRERVARAWERCFREWGYPA